MHASQAHSPKPSTLDGMNQDGSELRHETVLREDAGAPF
jgi:hypothetical protein